MRPIFLLSALAFLCFISWPADASINISPTRVVFKGGVASEVVNVQNRGDKPVLYRISWKNYIMTEEGRITEVTEPDPRIQRAEPYIRYSPKQVQLQPGESQLVRLALRLPRDLPEGEYRSHLSFIAIPNAYTPSEGEKPTGVSIKIDPGVAISIPVVIEKGDLKVTPGITDLRFIKSTPENIQLQASLVREGNKSVIGDITVYEEGTGDGTPVHRMRFLGVYPEVNARPINISVPRNKLSAAKPKLRVVYAPSAQDRGLWEPVEQTVQVP